MKKIRVNLPSNGYDVLIGKNTFPKLLKEIRSRSLNKNLLLLVDTNVYKFHKEIIEKFYSSYPDKIDLLKIKCSEKLKSQETVEKIYSKLLAKNFGRDSLIVAVGGGILGDIAGYAASTYMRGIQFVQIPTTLLAAVDSSVGGKTGINFGSTKNIIGAFYQPKFVLVDTNFFTTLPKVELTCGVGEIIKYAFLTESKFYDSILKNLPKLYLPGSTFQHKVIAESVQFKANVVEQDEKEGGLRKILNLGHTFAHAIEVDQNHKIKHGQAVVVGIAAALFLSNELSLITESELTEYLELIKQFQTEINFNTYNLSNMHKIMLKDKKNRDGKIKFVLLKSVGNIAIDIEVNKKTAIFALKNGIEIFSK